MDYLRIYVKEADVDRLNKKIKLACPLIIKEAMSDNSKRNWGTAGGVALGAGAVGGGLHLKKLKKLKNIKRFEALKKPTVSAKGSHFAPRLRQTPLIRPKPSVKFREAGSVKVKMHSSGLPISWKDKPGKVIKNVVKKTKKGLFNKALTGLWVGDSVLDTLKYSPKGLPF